jgi:hypothetical protein
MATATPTANQPINAPTLPMTTPSPTPSPASTPEPSPTPNDTPTTPIATPQEPTPFETKFERTRPQDINDIQSIMRMSADIGAFNNPIYNEDDAMPEIQSPVPKPTPSPVKERVKMFEEKSKPTTSLAGAERGEASTMPEVKSPVEDTPKKTKRKKQPTVPPSPTVSEPDELKGVPNDVIHKKLQGMRKELGEKGIKHPGAYPGVRNRQGLVNRFNEYNLILNPNQK